MNSKTTTLNFFNKKYFSTLLFFIVISLITGCANINNSTNNDNNITSNNTINNTNNTDNNNNIYVCKKSLGTIYIDIDKTQKWYEQLTKHQHLEDAYVLLKKMIDESRCFKVSSKNVVNISKKAKPKYVLTASATFSESVLDNAQPAVRTISNITKDETVGNISKITDFAMENLKITNASVSLTFRDISNANNNNNKIEISESSTGANINAEGILKKLVAFFSGVNASDVERFNNSKYANDKNVQEKISGKTMILEAFAKSYKSLLKELINKNYISADNYYERTINSDKDLRFISNSNFYDNDNENRKKSSSKKIKRKK